VFSCSSSYFFTLHDVFTYPPLTNFTYLQFPHFDLQEWSYKLDSPYTNLNLIHLHGKCKTVFIYLLLIFLQILNIIILVLYRVGYDGRFLGVGGTWNLNEEKNPDSEIVASGVFVGFFIYTLVFLISFCFGTTEQKKSLVVSF